MNSWSRLGAAGPVRLTCQRVHARSTSASTRFLGLRSASNARHSKKAAKSPGNVQNSPETSNNKWHARSNGSRHPFDPNSRARTDFGTLGKGRYALLRSVVLNRFQRVLDELLRSKDTVSGLGGDELRKHAASFMDVLDNSFILAEQNVTRRDKNPLFWNIRDAFISREVKGLHKELHFAFQDFLIRQRENKAVEGKQQELVDFRFPHEWYPATRALQRTVHVHVGPTNSGKTYQALKALENARSGFYAGPLRLLAHETYHRLLAKGKSCALMTGEEILIPEDTDVYLKSCTVEMVPLNEPVDVCVIDEIQMLADPQRGNAWTTAFLGVQAKEVHVCGEERSVDVVQALCDSVGDKCVVHRYERLSPLETMQHSLRGRFSELRKGDAIVAFNRVTLHALKRNIEASTGRRCAIVYGSLPPEVRAQQAALFNDPDNDYDFIAASDAIGMGLNLEIRRVVMDSITKFDGVQNRSLTVPEVKQIGGRAGRFRSAQQAGLPDSEENTNPPGLITTVDASDIGFVQKAFRTTVPDIRQISLAAPLSVVEKFAAYYPPATPLSFILMRIKTMARTASPYSLSVLQSFTEVADLIQDIPMTTAERLVFCHMPASLSSFGAEHYVRALAMAISSNSNGALHEIKEIPLEYLDQDLKTALHDPVNYLWKIESLHSAVSQYLWLSYRFSGTFTTPSLATHVRDLVGQRLVEVLENMNFTEHDLSKLRRKTRWKAQTADKKRSALVQTAGEVDKGSEAEDWKKYPSMERQLAQ